MVCVAARRDVSKRRRRRARTHVRLLAHVHAQARTHTLTLARRDATTCGYPVVFRRVDGYDAVLPGARVVAQDAVATTLSHREAHSVARENLSDYV